MPRPIDRVLLACGNAAQQTDGSWLTNCPVHGDANPSLVISEDPNDGKVLLVCRSQRCPAADVVRAWGLTMRDLFPQGLDARTPEPGAPQHSSEKPIAVHDYVNVEGVLLFQVLKYQGTPRFRQRRPSHREPPADLWTWNRDGTADVPYRLPEVAAAVRFGHRIYVVEGEKDADAVAALGLVATTNAGGAGNWTAECAKWLHGAKAVTIVPDNDAAGAKHARAVRESLIGKAGKVRILSLPDLQPKGDVSDWIAAGGTAETLEAMANAGPDSRGWTRAGVLVAEPLPDVDWIITNVLARPSLAIVSGDADSYKSWSLTSMCVSAAVEGKWFGRFAIAGRRSMLVTADEDRAETRRKIAWLAKGMELSEEDMAILSENMLVWIDDLSFDDDASFQALVEDVEDFAPDIVVVDHLRVCFDGNEDSSEFARKVKLRGKAIYKTHPCAVAWIHHVRKLSGEQGLNVARQRVRGSGGLVQSVDHHIAFQRDDGERETAVVVMDRNKKGPRMQPFSISARIVDSEGMAAIEYGGDPKFAAGTSAAPGQVLLLLRADPREWSRKDIVAALDPPISDATVRRALDELEHRRAIFVTEHKGGIPRKYQARETTYWSQNDKRPAQPAHDLLMEGK